MRGGSGESLLPSGCNIEAVPHDLHLALEHAYKILNWQENLSDDEMPPRWMWHLDWELEAHFATVRRKRDEKFGTSDSSAGGEPEDLWEENSLASRFKK
jgi:hypothetical protein